MSILNRQAQVGGKIEAADGTEEALVAANFRGNRKDTSHTLTKNEYDRALERASLTKFKKLVGSISGRISFTEELVGGAHATAPPWDVTLRAMGFNVIALQGNQADTLTNTFKPGELIGDNAAEASATKTARFVEYNATLGVLIYMPLTGGNFASAETVYGYGSTPQPTLAVTGAAQACGRGYHPLTETDASAPPSATYDRRIGGESYALVGCRGTGSISLRQNEPVLIQAEMTGVPQFDVDADGDLVIRTESSVSPEPFASAPKVTRGIPLRFRNADGSYTPIATEVVITMGNQIAQRPSIADNSIPLYDDGAGVVHYSGFMSTRITDREPSATIDPEHILAADGFDFFKHYLQENTFEISAQVGAGDDDNGYVMIVAPEVGISGDIEPGDRDGIMTTPLNLMLYGDQDDELFVFHVFYSGLS